MAKRTLKVAAIQASFGPDMAGNIAKVEKLVRHAAKGGAQVILPPELFQGIYFPTRQDPKWFATAYPAREHPAVGAWLERIRAIPGWAHPYDLMPGHPLPA